MLQNGLNQIRRHTIPDIQRAGGVYSFLIYIQHLLGRYRIIRTRLSLHACLRRI